jgi:hypothetical protein
MNKAMRALFGLKRSINKTKLSFRSLTTLFDSLIKPIALYGAPIWTPTLPIINSFHKSLSSPSINSQSLKNLLTKISNSHPEKIHLHFLKWALGVHRKSSNVGVWGESGRYPLIYECIKLTLNYFKRLNTREDGSLVSLALQDQKALNLNWYKNIVKLFEIDSNYTSDHVTASKLINRSNSQPRNNNNDINNGIDMNYYNNK